VEAFGKDDIALLVGDNPFHSISHLSQDRTRLRDKNIALPGHAADLILNAVDNGANGFMFSVSETTLAILKELRNRKHIERLSLYPIVPYAYEYVKLSTQVGGIPGLTKKVARRIVISLNFKAMMRGIIGFLRSDPASLLMTYADYEVGRVKSAAGKKAHMECLILHEVVTDLALAMGLDWLFKTYINYVKNSGITPGFNTVNFSFLVDKFMKWQIDTDNLVIASPFNKVGFQMAPCKEDCEQALKSLRQPTLIAISVLAAGYLKPSEAMGYIATLPNVRGVAVGVSNENHARDTFALMKEKLKKGYGSASPI